MYRLCSMHLRNLLFLCLLTAMEIQHQQNGRLWMDIDILGQALFERVLLSKEDLMKSVLIDSAKINEEGHVVQTQVIHYLAECYLRCHNKQIILEKMV